MVPDLTVLLGPLLSRAQRRTRRAALLQMVRFDPVVAVRGVAQPRCLRHRHLEALIRDLGGVALGARECLTRHSACFSLSGWIPSAILSIFNASSAPPAPPAPPPRPPARPARAIRAIRAARAVRAVRAARAGHAVRAARAVRAVRPARDLQCLGELARARVFHTCGQRRIASSLAYTFTSCCRPRRRCPRRVAA